MAHHYLPTTTLGLFLGSILYKNEDIVKTNTTSASFHLIWKFSKQSLFIVILGLKAVISSLKLLRYL